MSDKKKPYPYWRSKKYNRGKQRKKQEKRLKQERLRQLFNESLLQNPVEMYPEARELQRHFILHVGETNTGKTYEALQDLAGAESGLYLAPLRLLALEVQERLLAEGVECSMTTGEEDDYRIGAHHLSCTVEKMDSAGQFGVDPKVAVIDEAQMLQDPDRGWAWLKAILGLACERIHVCMSPNAEQVVEKLIDMCGDTWEVVRHTRDVPLRMENRQFQFPGGVQKHDALVVFSKKKVLSVASELEKHGIKTSVIYGALPYSVRKDEMRKFLEGESSVVVCTDAIGMGMNLPIRRVVFLESEKFDGRDMRPLSMSEVKQIAGRAGRKGQFDEGLVNALSDKKRIRRLLIGQYQPMKYAVMQMPQTLVDLDIPLSEIITNWMKVQDTEFLRKADMRTQLSLARILEKPEFATFMLDKDTQLALVNIPFDSRDHRLLQMWKNLILDYYSEKPMRKYVPVLHRKATLEDLEEIYRECDLVFSFVRTVQYTEEDLARLVSRKKERVAAMIMQKLSDKNFTRTCRQCGKPLYWNYPFSICQDCFQKNRRRKWDAEDWEDYEE